MASASIPRLLIAGTTSGVGKTTITSAIIGAFRNRGLSVQPYKCGPDYIDPSHLERAAGRPTRNLDSWMLPHPVLQELFQRSAAPADVAVLEGMMGLFDGRTGEGETGSTAQIAKLVGAPVVLVIDASKVGRSAAATVLGFRQFDPQLNLRGVILNQIASERHRQIVADAIEEATGLPVLGAFPRSDAFRLDERHLGLVQASESTATDDRMSALAAAAEQHCDIPRLLAIAREAPTLSTTPTGLFPAEPLPKTVRIGVAQDRAFSFYYQDNLDLLEAWGAETVPFSPLTDKRLPEHLNGLYIGGGYPELHAAELAANQSMQNSIRHFAQQSSELVPSPLRGEGEGDVRRLPLISPKTAPTSEYVPSPPAGEGQGEGARRLPPISPTAPPILGECGGLMYLTQAITDFDGQRHPMVGLMLGECMMERRRVGLGYLTVKVDRSSWLLKQGNTLRGHEFHWSRLTNAIPHDQSAFSVEGQPDRREGYAYGNLLASYVHFHFGAQPDIASRFVAACRAASIHD